MDNRESENKIDGLIVQVNSSAIEMDSTCIGSFLLL